MKFINADDPNIIYSYPYEVMSILAYDYCQGNPVMFVDDNGEISYSTLIDYMQNIPGVVKAQNLVGFSWDRSQSIWYAKKDAPQRAFGYCKFYDDIAHYVGIYIDRKRIPFKYDNKEYAIWLWKGQYGICLGAEVGFYVYLCNITIPYYNNGNSIPYYRCANNDEMLKMSFVLYNRGKKIFERPMQKHWWVTGFRPCTSARINCSYLHMQIKTEFKNSKMAKAFCNSKYIKNWSRVDKTVIFRW